MKFDKSNTLPMCLGRAIISMRFANFSTRSLNASAYSFVACTLSWRIRDDDWLLSLVWFMASLFGVRCIPLLFLNESRCLCDLGRFFCAGFSVYHCLIVVLFIASFFCCTYMFVCSGRGRWLTTTECFTIRAFTCRTLYGFWASLTFI